MARTESRCPGPRRSSTFNSSIIRSSPRPRSGAAAEARRTQSARPPAPTASPAAKVATRNTTAQVVERFSMTAPPLLIVVDDGGEDDLDLPWVRGRCDQDVRDGRTNGGGRRRRAPYEIARRQRDDERGRDASARPAGEYGIPGHHAHLLGARQHAHDERCVSLLARVEGLSQGIPEHHIRPVIERQWILHPSSFQSASSTRKRRRAWNTSDRTVPSGIPRISAISPCE